MTPRRQGWNRGVAQTLHAHLLMRRRDLVFVVSRAAMSTTRRSGAFLTGVDERAPERWPNVALEFAQPQVPVSPWCRVAAGGFEPPCPVCGLESGGS